VHSPHQSHQKGSPRDRRCSIVAQDWFALLPHVDGRDGRQGYASTFQLRFALGVFPQKLLDARNFCGRPKIRSEYFERGLLAETRFQLFAVCANPLFELGAFRIATNQSPKISEETISNSHTWFSRNTPRSEAAAAERRLLVPDFMLPQFAMQFGLKDRLAGFHCSPQSADRGLVGGPT